MGYAMHDMKSGRLKWQLLLGVILIMLSAGVYYLDYLIFHDAHHIFIYLVGDLGFVFIEVLLVTLIIHELLEYKQKEARLDKLNMVIGAFFSEAGNRLLRILSGWDPSVMASQCDLHTEGSDLNEKYERVSKFVEGHSYKIDEKSAEWGVLKELLLSKRDFLVRLLENPTLMEHELFTDMLWSVFHLAEELEARDELEGLPDGDLKHLTGDVQRVYGSLARQWLKYMEHLEKSYPYLFSLSVRMSPFDQNASPIIDK